MWVSNGEESYPTTSYPTTSELCMLLPSLGLPPNAGQGGVILMNPGNAVSRAAPTVHVTSAANDPPDDERKLQVPPSLAHVVSDGPGPYTQVSRQVVDMLIDQGELPPAPAAIDAATNARHASGAFDVRLEPVLPFVECGPGSCTQLARRGVAMLLDQGTVSLPAPTVHAASAAYEPPDEEAQLQVLPPLAHVVSDGPGPYTQAARQVVDMLIEQGELPPASAAVNAATNTAIDAPLQNNGIDCGVYMLLNATFISKGEALDYTTADITAASELKMIESGAPNPGCWKPKLNVNETGAPNPGCWKPKLNVNETGAPNPGCWKPKLNVHKTGAPNPGC
ncbi:hypothetical protein CYMTET_3223 [Cymbomonas tetramitiformis]|uniref:Uncharacterized protein n=1 Tax=Cymbomonas tetramitiformis TaxID=36881 RepID=A0AAE0LLR4_9CHLO|nr:hypothetical protein CYMTET_3223 [Cymbomonas tetramitiformis]